MTCIWAEVLSTAPIFQIWNRGPGLGFLCPLYVSLVMVNEREDVFSYLCCEILRRVKREAPPKVRLGWSTDLRLIICCIYLKLPKNPLQRLEFQRTTTQQTQVHLRLTWGSIHGSYCSNIDQIGLTWALHSVPIILFISLVMAKEWGGAFFWPIDLAICVVIHIREWDCIEGCRLRSASGD